MNNIESLVREFTNQLEAVIRANVRNEVLRVIGGELGNGKAPAKNGKRTDKKSLEQMVLGYVSRNPGTRMEPMCKALGYTADQLRPAAHRLLKANMIKAKGKARGTNYSLA